MTKYYKGELFNIQNVGTNHCTIFICNDKIVYYKDDFKNILKTISSDKVARLIKSINRDSNLVNKDSLIANLDDMFYNVNYFLTNSCYREIIYELIEDEKGNLYGKELISGSIFPIVTKVVKKYTNLELEPWKFLCYQYNSNICLYETTINSDNFIRTDKYNDRIYHTVGVQHYDGLYSVYTELDSYVGDYQKVIGYKLEIAFTHRFSHDNLLRGEVFLQEDGYANIHDIEEYRKRYHDKKTFFGKVKNDFVQEMKEKEKLNVFKEIIVPKNEEKIIKHETVDGLVKLMEEIELLLLKLKNYNPDLYAKYIDKYNKMLEDDSKNLKTVPITKGSLEGLKAEIMMSFYFNHDNGMDIFEYLDNLKKKYLLNILDGEEEKTKVTISDLDKMTELFLKMQNEYSIVNKRKIMRNIALLYLFELYENKDNLDNLNLENSYLNDNLVSVLICLNTLKELDLIESDVLINLNSDIQLEDVIYIVKNITFKKISQEKVLSLTI